MYGVAQVEADAVLNPGVARRRGAAFKPAFNDVDGQPKARATASAGVLGGGFPHPGHHIVTGWLRQLRRHPKPQRRLTPDDPVFHYPEGLLQ